MTFNINPPLPLSGDSVLSTQPLPPASRDEITAPLTHWQLRRPTMPTVMQAIRQPLIAAANHAEMSRQMLKHRDAPENIAATIANTLTEILRASQGLQQVADMLGHIESGQRKKPTTNNPEIRLFKRAFDTLTARELQVLSAAVDGLNSQEIADKLRISRRTVESHRAHVARKFKVGSLSELYRQAAAFGIALGPGGGQA